LVKFAGNPGRPQASNIHGPVTTGTEQTTTFEGSGAHKRTPESDLFVCAAANMVGEDSFYEDASTRDKRFVDLIHEVTRTNPEFIAGSMAVMDDPPDRKGWDNHPRGLVDYLRRDLLMRSASVVLACEYVRAGGPRGRLAIDAACQRPDEPAEVLGYWLSTHGRSIPQAVKRGVADAVRRLYTERAALRYDGQSRGLRMGDVIELVHPKPRDARQAALFKYLLDERHHGDGTERFTWVSGDGDSGEPVLPILHSASVLASVPEGQRRDYLRHQTDVLKEAGWSWERLSGWLPGGMDAEAWGWVIPNMGVMALVRNLRNFDQAGISDAAVDAVIAKITSDEEVGKARLFPFHAWQAYREAPSDNWKRALGTTLDLTTRNIPADLDGSLVVIDCSGSMQSAMSGRSKLHRWEVAAVLGAALAHGTRDSNVVAFGQTNLDVTQPRGSSALHTVERVQRAVQLGEVGHSTFGHTAIREHWRPGQHRRAFIVTDDQMHDSAERNQPADAFGRPYGWSGGVDISHVPLVYTVTVGGYRASSLPSGERGRYTLAGFGDAGFTTVAAIEAGRDARWEF
jgi:hypothetical protein